MLFTYSGLKAGQKYVSDSGLVVFMYILNFVVFKATKINLWNESSVIDWPTFTDRNSNKEFFKYSWKIFEYWVGIFKTAESLTQEKFLFAVIFQSRNSSFGIKI